MTEKKPLAPENCANYGCQGCRHPQCDPCKLRKKQRVASNKKPKGFCKRCGETRLNSHNQTGLCALCRKGSGMWP